MPITLYNTLSRRRETFTPLSPPRVTMYVCGPTVYNFAHIGNARPAVVFDVLARLLRRDYDLTYARNVTDVDDKINEAAREEGVGIDVITARYLAAYHEDMRGLGVLPPDIEPRVTTHMPEIVDMIRRLVDSGHAYVAEGHVLFAVDTFPEYGRLSRRALDDLIAGARVEVAPYKRSAGDFVLWKPSAPEVVGWDSPWGRGRPGWHIECSTMVESHLGATVDIHGGGQDLVFPHHENEIAQSTCAHAGVPYCRYWVHNGFVNVASEKMSKSLGNVVLVHDLRHRHPGETIRMALLSAHYRQPLDWTEHLIAETQTRLDRLYGVLREAGIEGEAGHAPGTAAAPAVLAALEDDLNTPLALAELASLARAANRSATLEQRREIATALRAAAWYLGLLSDDPQAWFSRASQGGDDALEAETIEALLSERLALRKSKDFAAADRIRDDLARAGIVIEDGPDGSRWHRAR
jgi:cysteinyl-tRNA synthetase